jgi:hypothetical protein
MSIEGYVPGPSSEELIGGADREGISQFKALLRVKFPVDGEVHRRFAIGQHTVTIERGPDVWDAGVYESRVIGRVALRESLGSKPLGGVVLPDLAFEVARRSANRDSVEALLNLVNAVYDAVDPSGGRIEVWLHLTAGDELNEATLRFHGEVRDDGVEITADRIRFRATDWLARYDQPVPAGKFYAQTDAAGKNVMDPDLDGEPVPILYGDWSDRGSYFAAPAAIVDRRVAQEEGNHTLTCQLGWPSSEWALPDVGPVAQWQSSGGELRGTAAWRGKFAVMKAPGARFLLCLSDGMQDAEVNVWEKGDEVYPITARGLRDSRTGDLLEEPALIARDLLVRLGGVPEAAIGTSFDEIKTDFRFRAWLDRPRRLITETLADLCRDAGLLLTVRAGRFEIERSLLAHWEEPGSAPAIRLDARRVLDGQRHKIQPSGWKYDGVAFSYRQIPRTKKCERTVSFGRQGADATVLRVDSDWVWREIDALEIAGTWRAALHVPSRHLELDLPAAGLGLHTNRRVSWTGDGAPETIYYVWDCERDFDGGVTTLRLARRSLAFDGATWASETVPAFSNDLAEADKERWGWWTKPGEAAERWSSWRTES